MRRDQLEHAIRTACQILGFPKVIVSGSTATMSALPSVGGSSST